MNDIERQVLTLIGEDLTNPDVFTDTEEGMAPIRQSVNDAIQQMCAVTGSYKRQVFLVLRQNALFYRIVSTGDYIAYIVQAMDRARRFRLVQSHPLRLAADDIAWMKRTGEPTHYMQICHDIVGIWRKPTYSGKVLELECVMIPREYGYGDQVVRLRRNFQEGAVMLAVSEYYASRGDAPRATDWFNKYLQAAQLMKLAPADPSQQFRMGGFRQAGFAGPPQQKA